MILVEDIKENILHDNVGESDIVAVAMAHDEMQKVHRKITVSGDIEIALSLRPGSCLRDGDVLYRDAEKIICVVLKEEQTIYIKPRSVFEWAKIAYNIGNMHHTAFLKENGIYTPYDDAVLRMVKKLEINYEIVYCKLDGERANIQGAEYSNHHDHHHT